MIGSKRVIAVCMTKVQWSGRSEYLDRLNHHAFQNGYKVMVFNSFVDFYKNDANDRGAQSVYDLINYDIVDALIISYESFNNKELVHQLAEKARGRGCPVLLLDYEMDGCSSIHSDYDDAYTELMTHVIEEHQAKDTFFIAGLREGDPNSGRRIACYKRALENCGLEYKDANLDYGEYWSDPARRIVQRLRETRKQLPQVFFCANDYMAIAVCDELNQMGYRVPEDIVVTGFDGTDAARYAVPQITTCAEDQDNLARLSILAVDDAITKGICSRYLNTFKPIYTESCGCKRLSHLDFRELAATLHGQLDAVQSHEDYMYAWMNRMFAIRDMNGLYNAINSSILENSYVCLNGDVLSMLMDGRNKRKEKFTEKMVVLTSCYTRGEEDLDGHLARADMVPGLQKWENSRDLYVISALYVGEKVCGYYAYRSYSMMKTSHKIKRIVNTVNLGFTVASNYFMQDRLRESVEKAALINSVSGLPNLKGALEWFHGFATPENRKKTLCVSVYGLPKYTYILENYGIEAAEEAERFVTEALKLANPEKCFIGHIADDEFVLVNEFDPEMEDISTAISTAVNKSTSVFFGLLEEYNSGNNKEYYVEVNCGCSPVDAGWDDNLESFIKFAKSEMYMNRLRDGMGSVLKEETAPKEYYMAFELLIEKNLFNYHFQPIVSAKNGEIYGYEALMRTDKSIGMNPLEVLNAAREYNRLYEIEKATMFNIMSRYAKEREKFCGKQVFINTIPGYFLKENDVMKLNHLHGAYMDRFVFELTEQNTVSDDELNAIRNFSGGAQSGRIAIDDYGTGHSNMANLLRYKPRIIKIDRFLIENIHRNLNKQQFVRSTVEFAKMNGIMVLAEGVETSNELHTVIDLGVDLVQGYYLGRPVLDPVAEIPEDIRQEILHANPVYTKPQYS